MSKKRQLREAMRIVEVARYAARLLLAAAIGLALVGFLPAAAQASTNPVDLELGGEGATPWVIGNIKPGDSGTKTVELRNVGSMDGFVTIWVSDIISSEGVNPEPETEIGDTTEPGELDYHLTLDITVAGLSTNLKLPTVFKNLPSSATGAYSIEVIPLKAGDTVNLQWEWELPTRTGNVVQGDIITFTTNYLLQEFQITDLSDVVSEEGTFTEEVTTESESGKGKLAIAEDTVGLTEEGEPLTELWLIEIDKEPSAPSEDTVTVGAHFVLGPDGATFDPPITLTATYDPNDMPVRAHEGELVIAVWDEAAGEWVTLEGCTVDPVNNTISAPVSHFSRYTVISPVPPPPPPAYYSPPEPIDEVEDLPPTTTARLEVNMLGQESSLEIGAAGTLLEPLTLTDPSGDFIIDIDSGTRITGFQDAELSRIELMLTDEPIVVPDDIVVLSPVYQLTGYTRSMEVTRINFQPYARLTIRYDPQNLPENTFLPFIANYTDEQGLVRLQPPPDATVGIGEAKALIDHASLFVVVAEVAPPPPPLPARFEASNLTINPRQAQLGQPIIVSLTVTNEGETEGSLELHLIIDGIVRVVREITLAGKSSETLTFEVSNLAAGKHQVKIAGLTEQLRVEMTVTPPGEEEVNWLIIDLSVGAALVAGALVLYFFTQRARRARSKERSEN